MNQQYLLWLVLVSLFVCFPHEATEIAAILAVKTKIVFLNAVLFLYAYFIYIRIAWALKSQGIRVPPFKFTPIESRNDV